jgi:hypothetical protein
VFDRIDAISVNVGKGDPVFVYLTQIEQGG